MSGSQEDASAVADGRLSDGSRSSQVSPRTPDGPLETRMRRSPIFSIGQVVQKSRPVSSSAFSSRVSAASAPAIFESLVRAVMTPFLLVFASGRISSAPPCLLAADSLGGDLFRVAGGGVRLHRIWCQALLGAQFGEQR